MTVGASLPTEGHDSDNYRAIIINFVDNRALAMTEKRQVAVGRYIAEVFSYRPEVRVLEMRLGQWIQEDDGFYELRGEDRASFHEDECSKFVEHIALVIRLELSVEVEVECKASCAPMLKASMAHSGEVRTHNAISFQSGG